MQSVQSTGSRVDAWADASAARAAAKQKFFADADKDGDGKINKSELQGIADKIKERGGKDLGNVDDLFKEMDTAGAGSLSIDQVEVGLNKLMSPPNSTFEMAQRQGGADGGRLPAAGEGDSEGGAGRSGGIGPIQQTASAKLADLIKSLDTDGDGNISASEIENFTQQANEAANSTGSTEATDAKKGEKVPEAKDAASTTSTTSAEDGELGEKLPVGAVGSSGSSASSELSDKNATRATDSTNKIQELLKALDKDEDGTISASELSELKNQFQPGQALPPVDKASTDEDAKVSSESKSKDVDASRLSAMALQAREIYREAEIGFKESESFFVKA